MFPKVLTQSLAMVVIQWLIIKFVLVNTGIEGMGRYFFYLSLLSPVFMFLTGHFKNYATQNVYGDWYRLVNVRLLQISIIAVLSVFGFFYFSSLIFVLVVVTKLFEVGVDTKLAEETRKGKVTLTFKTIMLTLLFVVAAFFVLSELNLIIVWFSIMFCILVLSVLVPNLKNISLVDVKSKSAFVLIIKSVGLQSAVVALIAAVPRFTVEHFVSVEALAVFGAMNYFSLIAHVITMSLFQSRIRGIDNSFCMTRTKQSLLILLLIGLFGVAVSLFAHEHLVNIIFNKSLVEYSHWLPWFLGFIVIWSWVSYLEQTVILTGGSGFLVKLNTMLLISVLIVCPLLVIQFSFIGVVTYMYCLNTVKLLLLWLYLLKVNGRGQLAV